jgi:hypothetical protein
MYYRGDVHIENQVPTEPIWDGHTHTELICNDHTADKITAKSNVSALHIDALSSCSPHRAALGSRAALS